MPALTSLLAGLGTGLSLIIAIGAQNAFVLRQGLRREHITVVVVLCALSDAVLIAAGTAGLGALITSVPALLDVVRWAGAAFLVYFGIKSARRAMRPDVLHSSEGGTGITLASAVTTTLALTWLNPHVYLDTVIFLGVVAAGHGSSRWYFALGAMIGSVIWFSGLGYGARFLAPVFSRPSAWRILDGAIAVVMVGLAASLIFML